MLHLLDFVRKPLIIFLNVGQLNTFPLTQAGKTTHAQKRSPENTQQGLLFLFFRSLAPSALLRIIHASALTLSSLAPVAGAHVRRTLLNLANWSDSSTQWLCNRQSRQGK